MLVKVLRKKYVLSLDLNTESESLLIIVSGNEFRWSAQSSEKHVSQSLFWWTACPVVVQQMSGVSVDWRESWCDGWGTSVLWRCCGSWRSTQRPCIRFCVEWAASAAHAIMARHELVVETGGRRSWLHYSALAAVSGCCRLERRTATSYSSPVWSVWGCRLVSLQVPWTVAGVYGGWPGRGSCRYWYCMYAGIVSKRLNIMS